MFAAAASAVMQAGATAAVGAPDLPQRKRGHKNGGGRSNRDGRSSIAYHSRQIIAQRFYAGKPVYEPALSRLQAAVAERTRKNKRRATGHFEPIKIKYPEAAAQ